MRELYLLLSLFVMRGRVGKRQLEFVYFFLLLSFSDCSSAQCRNFCAADAIGKQPVGLALSFVRAPRRNYYLFRDYCCCQSLVKKKMTPTLSCCCFAKRKYNVHVDRVRILSHIFLSGLIHYFYINVDREINDKTSFRQWQNIFFKK